MVIFRYRPVFIHDRSIGSQTPAHHQWPRNGSVHGHHWHQLLNHGRRQESTLWVDGVPAPDRGHPLLLVLSYRVQFCHPGLARRTVFAFNQRIRDFCFDGGLVGCGVRDRQVVLHLQRSPRHRRDLLHVRGDLGSRGRLRPGVDFINILRLPFVPIFLLQKIT